MTKLKQNVTLNTDILILGEETALYSQSFRYWLSYTGNVLSCKYILDFQYLTHFGIHYFFTSNLKNFHENMQNFKDVIRLLSQTGYFFIYRLKDLKIVLKIVLNNGIETYHHKEIERRKYVANKEKQN